MNGSKKKSLWAPISHLEKKNLQSFFSPSAVENRLRFSTAEECLFRFACFFPLPRRGRENKILPFLPISGKERSKIPQKKHAFSEGSRISLTLLRRVKEIQDLFFLGKKRSKIFFPSSPPIPSESEGTRRLPSKIACDFRRQARVLFSGVPSDSRPAARIS